MDKALSFGQPSEDHARQRITWSITRVKYLHLTLPDEERQVGQTAQGPETIHHGVSFAAK
jgi:hypothetical protein